MEFKTLGVKLARHEASLVEDYCKRKDTTPSALIHEILLHEIKVPIPHYLAGNNFLKYNKSTDTFSWSVVLDTGEAVEIMPSVSPQFLETLQTAIKSGLENRNQLINKHKQDSAPVPTALLRKKR